MMFPFNAMETEQRQMPLNYTLFSCLYVLPHICPPIPLLSSLHSCRPACVCPSLSLWRRFKPDILGLFFISHPPSFCSCSSLSYKPVNSCWAVLLNPWIRPKLAWTQKDSKGSRSRTSWTMPTKTWSVCRRNWPAYVAPLKRRWLILSQGLKWNIKFYKFFQTSAHCTLCDCNIWMREARLSSLLLLTMRHFSNFACLQGQETVFTQSGQCQEKMVKLKIRNFYRMEMKYNIHFNVLHCLFSQWGW